MSLEMFYSNYINWSIKDKKEIKYWIEICLVELIIEYLLIFYKYFFFFDMVCYMRVRYGNLVKELSNYIIYNCYRIE